MVTTKHLTISATLRPKITVDLVGREYVATSPKSAVAMLIAEKFAGVDEKDANVRDVWEQLTEWVKLAFNKTASAEIIKRLRDPEDPLDVEHIVELIDKMSEAATGNPTTSSSDS